MTRAARRSSRGLCGASLLLVVALAGGAPAATAAPSSGGPAFSAGLEISGGLDRKKFSSGLESSKSLRVSGELEGPSGS
jgi:hypothetical protein